MRRGGLKEEWPWARIALYGILLALGAIGLQWVDYRRMGHADAQAIDIFLIAFAFLGLGVFVGWRVAAPRLQAFDGNPQALAALGISPRELDVLHELAAGRSNKEIARRLGLSPNTVKTHIARLFEKLGANRRTDAINRARALGLLQ